MKNKIITYIKNNLKKEHLILIGMGILLIIIGILSWELYFSKYDIFEKQEKRFQEVVEEYFLYHSIYLPKEGLTKTITLEDLFLENRIEELYVPKTNQLCDLNSWVKVYNDNGNYIYNTYLKCGKYESSVDHEGPVITLNGDSTIYVHLNHEYEELGVSKVVDNTDGEMDVNQVVIDNSKVDVSKVGKYQVTYSIMDQLNNETKVTRTVIVARNLTEVVKEQAGENGYYQGTVNNNYILFSGMLYRIINVNSDGTVTLISNENLNNLRADYETYENSNIDKYLNNVYLNIIYDQSYLVDTEFCVGSMISREQASSACDQKVIRKVGILSYNDFLNTLVDGKGYLCTNYNYALANKVNDSILTANGDNNCTSLINSDVLPSIRPVITLKNNLLILAGDGTSENPYKLGDYSYGKTQDKINTRLIGEYVNYSGNIYRIMSIDENENVVLISIDGLSKNIDNVVGSQFLTSSVSNDKKFVFSLTEEDNPGYLLNNDYIDYINDSYIVKEDYIIPTNSAGINYSKYTNKKIYAKITLPKTYDLFAGKQSSSRAALYLYIDESTSEDKVFVMNVNNGQILEAMRNIYGKYCLKIVITVKGNLLIKSGNGTINSPYYIR